jgi:hypothetical protein
MESLNIRDGNFLQTAGAGRGPEWSPKTAVETADASDEGMFFCPASFCPHLVALRASLRSKIKFKGTRPRWRSAFPGGRRDKLKAFGSYQIVSAQSA